MIRPPHYKLDSLFLLDFNYSKLACILSRLLCPFWTNKFKENDGLFLITKNAKFLILRVYEKFAKSYLFFWG
jgi:hypothetical protein